jgi:arsenate reductase (thioredoxin)
MTDSPTTPARSQRDLSIDQGLALQAAAERLESEFGDTFDAETIDRFLDAAHAHFAHHASVPNFLPLLSERFAQQQLRALARVDGKHHDGKPTVLFLCTHNLDFRSF